MKAASLFVFLGFFALVILFSFFSRWGRILDISFTADQTVQNQEQIIQELKENTKPYIGAWIWQVSIKKLEKKISEHPKVQQAWVRRSWPSSFHVFLLSPKPVFLLMGPGQFYPVTADGSLLKPLNSQDIPDLPFLRGKLQDNAELRKKALLFFSHLPKKGLFSQSHISEMRYAQKEQNFYFYLLSSGLAVRVGENLSEFRPDRVESVLKYLQQKKIKWRVIDARFSQKVVVSLDKAP